jgi:hypothetical protein
MADVQCHSTAFARPFRDIICDAICPHEPAGGDASSAPLLGIAARRCCCRYAMSKPLNPSHWSMIAARRLSIWPDGIRWALSERDRRFGRSSQGCSQCVRRVAGSLGLNIVGPTATRHRLTVWCWFSSRKPQSLSFRDDRDYSSRSAPRHTGRRASNGIQRDI